MLAQPQASSPLPPYPRTPYCIHYPLTPYPLIPNYEAKRQKQNTGNETRANKRLANIHAEAETTKK